MKPSWRHAAIATAVLAAWLPARALELGALRLLSQRGQPLRAEVELLQLKPDEAPSLKLSVAPLADFAQHQLVWSDVLNTIALSQRLNPDGSTTLLLSSEQPLQIPAFDLMLRADWSGGARIKAYTVVLGGAQSELAGAATTAPAPAPRYAVKRGDTLSSIARALPQAAAYDQAQLLVALQQDNPDAFVDHNVNRLRAGAVLKLPGSAAIAAVDVRAAQQTLSAQTADFDAWRQQLAARASALADTRDDTRSSGGRVQADVHDASAAQPQDRLKLTQAASGSRAATEASLIAAQQQSQQLQQQLQSINARVAALSQLVARASAAAGASQAHASARTGFTDLLKQWLAPLGGVAVALLAAIVWLRRRDAREAASLRAAAPMPEFARAALALDLNLGGAEACGHDGRADAESNGPAVRGGAEPAGSNGVVSRSAPADAAPGTDLAGDADPDASALRIDLAGFDDRQAQPQAVPPRPLFDLSSISLELEPEQPPAAGAESSAESCPASRSD